MNSNTTGRSVIAGLFHDGTEAEHALAELKRSGFSQAEISEAEGDATHDQAATQLDRNDDRLTDNRLTDDRPFTGSTGGTGTSGFFSEHETHATSFVDELKNLGFSDGDSHRMVDGLVKGGSLVTANTQGGDMASAAAILGKGNSHIYYTEGYTPATGAQTATAGAVGGIAAATALRDDDRVDAGARELQLREERLQIDKQRVRHGEARISKRVVTNVQSIDVPVSHEELVIERRAGSGQVATGTIGSAQDTEIVVPLSQEVVQVEKTVVPTGEVVIGKRRVEGTEHVEETLRKEELRIDDATTGIRKPNTSL